MAIGRDDITMAAGYLLRYHEGTSIRPATPRLKLHEVQTSMVLRSSRLRRNAGEPGEPSKKLYDHSVHWSATVCSPWLVMPRTLSISSPHDCTPEALDSDNLAWLTSKMWGPQMLCPPTPKFSTKFTALWTLYRNINTTQSIIFTRPNSKMPSCPQSKMRASLPRRPGCAYPYIVVDKPSISKLQAVGDKRHTGGGFSMSPY